MACIFRTHGFLPPVSSLGDKPTCLVNLAVVNCICLVVDGESVPPQTTDLTCSKKPSLVTHGLPQSNLDGMTMHQRGSAIPHLDCVMGVIPSAFPVLGGSAIIGHVVTHWAALESSKLQR